MQIAHEKFPVIDGVLDDYLSAHPSMEERWLLEQTLYTGPTRRTIFEYFPFKPYSSVLDAGTGFGALALELAGQIPITVHAVDYDSSKLDVAKTIHNKLRRLDFFHEDSKIHFDEGNLYSLPYEDGQFDFVVSRFVYQHLRDPQAVTKEFMRVMRPGGYICIVAIDDQLTISYPEESGAFSKLQQAFSELQKKRGGDRYVGRKISTYLQQTGFEITATAIQPQAQHQLIQPDDLGVRFTLCRLLDAKDDIVEKGILSEQEFDECIEQLSHESAMSQFNANAQVVVIARKP